MHKVLFPFKIQQDDCPEQRRETVALDASNDTPPVTRSHSSNSIHQIPIEEVSNANFNH